MVAIYLQQGNTEPKCGGKAVAQNQAVRRGVRLWGAL